MEYLVDPNMSPPPSAANEVVAAWLEDRASRYGLRDSPLTGQDTAFLNSINDAFAGEGWAQCKTPEEQQKFIDDIRDIALRTTLEGRQLYSYKADEPLVPNWFPHSRTNEQGFLMEVYGKNPQLAKTFFDVRVTGLHFSHSGGLLSVLRNGGLLPFNELVRRGERIASGAHDGSVSLREGVSCVSLAPDRHRSSLWDSILGLMDRSVVSAVDIERRREFLAELEAEAQDNPRLEQFKMSHQKLEEIVAFINQPPRDEHVALEQELIRSGFGIAYAIKQSAILEERSRVFDDHRDTNKDKFFMPFSDVGGEFVVRGGIGLTDIGLILVPKDRMQTVNELLGDHDEVVVADIDDVPALHSR